MKRTQLSFWECFHKYPPGFCRLLAKAPRTRKGEKRARKEPMTDTEIALQSGIDLNRIREIKLMEGWDSLTFAEIAAYTRACGFDPTSPRDRHRIKAYEYICAKRNTRPLRYLRNSPKWESEISPVVMAIARSKPRSAA